MKALVVFHDHGAHVLDRFLKRGFRHCFVAVLADGQWIRLDGFDGRPVIEVVCPAETDLAAFYRQEGYTVVETEQRSQATLWPLVVANCVGLVKSVLCIAAPFVVTPYGLYRHLTRGQLLPGKSIFSPPKPPRVQQPVVPPERTDPAVTESREQLRLSELRRRGRAASILTSGQGDLEDAPLGRPAASAGPSTFGG